MYKINIKQMLTFTRVRKFVVCLYEPLIHFLSHLSALHNIYLTKRFSFFYFNNNFKKCSIQQRRSMINVYRKIKRFKFQDQSTAWRSQFTNNINELLQIKVNLFITFLINLYQTAVQLVVELLTSSGLHKITLCQEKMMY